MERERRITLAIGAGIAFVGCLASFGAATLLHADDGLSVLAGVFYGAPVVSLIAGFIVGSRSERRPQLDGAIAAELGFALGCAGALAFVPTPGHAVALFVLGHTFMPVWAFGVMGGGIGGALTRYLRRATAPA